MKSGPKAFSFSTVVSKSHSWAWLSRKSTSAPAFSRIPATYRRLNDGKMP